MDFLVLRFCIGRNKFKAWNLDICDGLTLKMFKTISPLVRPKLVTIQFAFFRMYVFFIKVGGILIVMETPFWEKIWYFSDLWHTLYKKSNLKNCILNESKWQDSFLLIPNNIPVILRQFWELNDAVLSSMWFLFSSALDSFFSECSTWIFSEEVFFCICMRNCGCSIKFIRIKEFFRDSPKEIQKKLWLLFFSSLG